MQQKKWKKIKRTEFIQQVYELHISFSQFHSFTVYFGGLQSSFFTYYLLYIYNIYINNQYFFKTDAVKLNCETVKL